MAVIYSRSTCGGARCGRPLRAACLCVQAPMVSAKRPPVSSSMVAAVCAITSGLRRRTTCVVPRLMRSVASPKAVMAETESRLV